MKRGSIILWLFVVVAAYSGVGGSTTLAQDNPSRERELEELVRKLVDRVEALEKRLADVERGKANPATGKRVEALEQEVADIKETVPSVSPADWEKFRKWIDDKNTLRPYWKDSLRFDSNDGSFKLTIGGRIQQDYAYFVEDGDIERRIGSSFVDNSEFRRARIYIAGTLYEWIDFKAQYDFAGGDADFKDVYIGLKGLAHVGNVRIGHFKEPFSLEELTSSNYITFLERSLVNTFAPARNSGIMFHNTMHDERMTWAVGIFRQSDSFGDGSGGRGYNATLRLTGLPVYQEGGKKLIHLGVAYTHQNYEDDTLRFRARPEVHLSPRVVDTGMFSAEFGDLIGLEAAYVDGPFSLQGEYVHVFIEGRSRRVGDPRFWAASIQASYFLTGEHRPYKKSFGAFGRVRPLENYNPKGEGRGAWELAARYSYLTLNDGLVRGGRLEDFTLGLNWYLNPSLRMMWNYVYADPSKGGDISAFLWRIQLAF